jgi:hypothetical protein
MIASIHVLGFALANIARSPRDVNVTELDSEPDFPPLILLLHGFPCHQVPGDMYRWSLFCERSWPSDVYLSCDRPEVIANYFSNGIVIEAKPEFTASIRRELRVRADVPITIGTRRLREIASVPPLISGA